MLVDGRQRHEHLLHAGLGERPEATDVLLDGAAALPRPVLADAGVQEVFVALPAIDAHGATSQLERFAAVIDAFR